jgi:hypothetical protein
MEQYGKYRTYGNSTRTHQLIVRSAAALEVRSICVLRTIGECKPRCPPLNLMTVTASYLRVSVFCLRPQCSSY